MKIRLNKRTKKESYHAKKAGLPPGSLVYLGAEKADKVTITQISYSETHYEEKELKDISETMISPDPDTTTWINIDGIHNTEMIESAGKHFDIHPLVLEDIVNTQHRPGAEEFDNYMFLALKMLSVDQDKKTIVSEHVSLVLGKNWVISFQENKVDIFEPFRERIRQAKGIIRQRKEDYIFYRLVDTIVDNYFLVTEFISEAIEDLEEEILVRPEKSTLESIYDMKKLIQELKKSIFPLREAVSTILRDESEYISEATGKYFRDVYEHIIQAFETIESQRETLTSFTDLYMSGLSNKMNQVMQFLTIFAAIFIPLTFIAGVYGMNFEYIPELQYKYGYFIVWGVMITVGLLMLRYFKKKDWL